MASVDMFDKKFKIADMKATGKIKWRKEQVNFLSACIIQVERRGQDHRCGVRGRDEKARTTPMMFRHRSTER